MTEFLSPEWFDEAREAAARAEPAADIDVRIAQEISGDSPLGWTVLIASGSVAIADGADPAADVRLSTDRETAVAIHEGRLSAQRAFLDGKLRIGGDMAVLMTHRSVLEAVGASL